MDTDRYTIEARGLSRSFGRTQILRGINVTLVTGDSFAVTGPNGSGKSTLLMILAGLQKQTRGTVMHRSSEEIHRDDWSAHIGYTGPLVNPYDELTAFENIAFAAREKATGERIESLLRAFNLADQRNKKTKHYSSGMKQRLKIILAVLNDPPVLFLDEPGTNLDGDGKERLSAFMDSARSRKIIVIATNDPAEASLCTGGIRLG